MPVTVNATRLNSCEGESTARMLSERLRLGNTHVRFGQPFWSLVHLVGIRDNSLNFLQNRGTQ